MKPLKSWQMILATSVIAGVVGYLYVRKSGGGSFSLASAAFEPPLKDIHPSAGELASHKAARPILEEAAKAVLGRDLTPAEMQYAQGVAFLETAYGKGWHESTQPGMTTANNWGAVSCKPTDSNKETCNGGIYDSYPDGTKYETGFERYPTPEKGAEDVIRHIFVNRKRTAAALADPKSSTFRDSYAMRRETYYGGFCPAATKQFGGNLTQSSFAHPDASDGAKACSMEAITTHANTVFNHARAIAMAMNEPLALRLGDYGDADTWYRKNYLSGGT